MGRWGDAVRALSPRRRTGQTCPVCALPLRQGDAVAQHVPTGLTMHAHHDDHAQTHATTAPLPAFAARRQVK